MRLLTALLLVVDIFNQSCVTASIRNEETSEEKTSIKSRMLRTLLPDTTSVEPSFRYRNESVRINESEESMNSSHPRTISSRQLVTPRAQQFFRTKGNVEIGGGTGTTEIILERKHKYPIEPGDIPTKGANQTHTIVGYSNYEEKSKATTFRGMGKTNTKMLQTAENSQEITVSQNLTKNVLQNSAKSGRESAIDSGITLESNDTVLLPELSEIDNQLKKNSTDTTLHNPLALGTEETTPPPRDHVNDSKAVVKRDLEGVKTGKVATGTTRASQSIWTGEQSMESSTTRDLEELLGKAKANGTEQPSDDLLGKLFETTALTKKSSEGKSNTGARKVAGGKVHEVHNGDTSTEKYNSDSGSSTQQTTTTPDKDDLDVVMSRHKYSTEVVTSSATDATIAETSSRDTFASHGPEDEPTSQSSQQTPITEQASEDDVTGKTRTTLADRTFISPATKSTAEDDLTNKVPTIMADWISTLHDVSNGTTVELSTSEDTEGTQRRSTAPTATPSPGTLFPKPPQHRNQTELNGNATHDHLHFYKGNMDDILLTIALIGLCVLLVVLIIICLGIRNEKKQDQMRKELLRKDMEDEQRLFVEFGRHPIQTLPTPPKHQITPTYPREEIVAPKETKLDMGGKAPVTTAPPPTPLRSTEIEFQTLDESAVEVYNDGYTSIRLKRPPRRICEQSALIRALLERKEKYEQLDGEC